MEKESLLLIRDHEDASSSGKKKGPSTTHDKDGTSVPLTSAEPKWLTLEFFFYYASVLWAVVYYIYITWKMSNEDEKQYSKYESLLSPGWMMGSRKEDKSDGQYRFFQNNLVMLGAFYGVFVLLSQVIMKRLIGKRRFHQIMGIVFPLALHGVLNIKIFPIVLINFVLAKSLAKLGQHTMLIGPAVIWIYNILVLFHNEYDVNGGYGSGIHPILSFLDNRNLWGIVPRWQIFFKFTVLRMISFAIDYFKYTTGNVSGNGNNGGAGRELLGVSKSSTFAEGHKKKCKECYWNERDKLEDPCDRMRCEQSCEGGEEDYSLLDYFAYLFYAPLYLAGPIITFNHYISQIRNPKRESTNYVKTLVYAIRWITIFLVMEAMLHAFHVIAIKERKAWLGFTAAQLGAVGYWNLKMIWLKLLIIWRFFRLVALTDGIVAPENMLRCMSNNYSVLMFWRSWHASYNLWIIRYLYIPLGGKATSHLNVWVVFAFVAFWHDIKLRLFAWSFLICLFIMPEVFVTYLSKKYQLRRVLGDWYYRHAKGLGAVFNVGTMMIANLIGFAVGLDGISYMLQSLLSWDGFWFCAAALVVIFSAVQIMFEVREQEYRDSGIMKPY